MTNLTIGLSLGAGVLLQAGFAWWLVATRRELARVNARLQRHADALAMLTDTSETGFGAMAREIARLGQQPPAPAPARARTTRRSPARAAQNPTRANETAVTESDAASPKSRKTLRLHLA